MQTTFDLTISLLFFRINIISSNRVICSSDSDLRVAEEINLTLARRFMDDFPCEKEIVEFFTILPPNKFFHNSASKNQGSQQI